MSVTCQRCRYFREGLTTLSVRSNQILGECRKHPPRIEPHERLDYGWRIWPAVWGRDDWCGEFSKIADEATK